MSDPVIAECFRIEEDSTLSAKGHFEAARWWGNANLLLGTIAAVVAALSGVSAIKDYPVVAALLAALSATLTAILTYVNPSGRANSHLVAGNSYKSLQNDTRLFRELEATSDSYCHESFRELSKRRNNLNECSTQIPRFAFEAARKGIESGEARYRVDSGGPT